MSGAEELVKLQEESEPRTMLQLELMLELKLKPRVNLQANPELTAQDFPS